ncbi:rho GTPase-activating protein 15 isoform X1 [Tachysurus ichikawai]
MQVGFSVEFHEASKPSDMPGVRGSKENKEQKQKVQALKKLVHQLPKPNHNTMKLLFHHLQRFEQNRTPVNVSYERLCHQVYPLPFAVRYQPSLVALVLQYVGERRASLRCGAAPRATDVVPT